MSIWFVTAILIVFFLGSKHSATFLAVGESVSPATGLGWVGGLGPSFGKAGPDFSGPVAFECECELYTLGRVAAHRVQGVGGSVTFTRRPPPAEDPGWPRRLNFEGL